MAKLTRWETHQIDLRCSSSERFQMIMERMIRMLWECSDFIICHREASPEVKISKPIYNE